MKQCLALIILFAFASNANAQFSRYRVQLRDKGATNLQFNNPSPYLSARAIERRQRFQIAIDSSDLPIPTGYIVQIQAIPNLILLNQSRWLNAVSIQTSDPNAINAILALPFVLSIDGIAARPSARVTDMEDEIFPVAIARGNENLEGDYFDYGSASFAEIQLHQGQFLHNIGLRGQGLQIAMLDGGFRDYNSLRAFDSVNNNNQVLSTWDFVARHASVSEDHPHGMMCLSTIAANIPGEFIGKAPKASFHLFRTEDVASEFPIEEFNWVCAAERADSIGADIISSSLGYGYEWSNPVADYPFSDLNGDITMAARGADMAAAKGLMVFNSAGNSGNDYWQRIITPADGDSVIAVGAVNSNGVVGSFSSYGPSADGRTKPDLASVGVAALVQGTSNNVGVSNGTSYACPNLAGLATCLWQGFPEFSNMQVLQALKESGHQYNSPDNRTGYGIPDMKKAFGRLLKEFVSTNITQQSCMATIQWTSKDVAAMKYILERKLPSESNFSVVTEWEAVSGSELETQQYSKEISLDAVGTGLIQFRIRQVLDTSAAGYFDLILDTVSLQLADPCPLVTANSVRFIPNPTEGPLQLQIETTDAVDNMLIVIYNTKGQIVYRQKTAKPAGRILLTLPAAQWAKGVYWVRVLDNKKEIGKASLLKL